MKDATILTQIDNAELIAIQFLISFFTVFAVVLSFVFAVTITALLVCFQLVRNLLVIVLTRKETGAIFALLGV